MNLRRFCNFMKEIHKKIWPEYFEAVLSGKKNFELRLNDFDVNEGDTLILEEWDPKTRQYTGRSVARRASYVGRWTLDDLAKFWPETDIREKGIQIISLGAAEQPREKFTKLVRDKIPDIIRSKGREPVMHVATDEEYHEKLNQKLQEEVNEYLHGEKPEELADILEVIEALATKKGVTMEELVVIKKKKLDERGGFAGKIILEQS